MYGAGETQENLFNMFLFKSFYFQVFFFEYIGGKNRFFEAA